MAKNKFQFDFDALSDIIEKLDKAGAELEKVLTEVLEDTAEEITQDTTIALAPAYLPAGGKYSTGTCKSNEALVHDPFGVTSL